MPKLPLQKGRADVAALTTGIDERVWFEPEPLVSTVGLMRARLQAVGKGLRNDAGKNVVNGVLTTPWVTTDLNFY